ncbi:haloacid dehalogenase-like hydrolase [Akkermansiaceae bacterium]|nr:haloacid dehalogenase-like hydrolase [bacterium]MDA7537576.1 haloacid dehalogenase-like hydrolase [Akkermansiaceae bacterium]MDA7629450.1 haloacid dehalogenase-like hydrolase [Akkermansiaceae bacterium]MDB4271346.1 haloacid dehalogenase-like hydrolase [Akkermansiaceae bacterium]MDB4283518.1 haloacid dehalogenase-like hydrolase [Akkermansiaceae bacterium]
MSSPQENVLFDLDQTIVPWDTQLVFRSYVLQQEGWRRALTLVFILFLPLNKLLGAGGMKRVFHCYLWGMKRERLEELAASFVRDWLPLLTYPEIISEIEKHRAEGRRLVLSSASPELWVQHIGKELGFDLSLGTLFEWGDQVEFFPDLIGENHKGQAKVTRLAELGISSGVEGYSDSRADLPLLALCEKQTLVNPLPGVKAHGAEHDWRLLEPPRPWKDRLAFGWGCTLQLFGLWKP